MTYCVAVGNHRAHQNFRSVTMGGLSSDVGHLQNGVSKARLTVNGLHGSSRASAFFYFNPEAMKPLQLKAKQKSLRNSWLSCKRHEWFFSESPANQMINLWVSLRFIQWSMCSVLWWYIFSVVEASRNFTTRRLSAETTWYHWTNYDPPTTARRMSGHHHPNTDGETF